MKKPDLEFYKKRREERTKQRQLSQRRQLILVATIILFGLTLIAALISKTSVAKIRSTIAKKNNGASEKKIVFAKSGSLMLYLPIARESLTTIGYHEAFNPRSFSLNPIGKEINAKRMSKNSVLKLKSESKELIYSFMWRGARSGPINSSVDIGAKAGTLTYSPVSGKVDRIRKYKLYGRYPDNEVHIRPEGYSDRHIVIIHINDIKVRTGDKVVSGLTPIGRIRQLSMFFKQQLSDYSKESGDHSHYQINKIVKNGKCHIER